MNKKEAPPLAPLQSRFNQNYFAKTPTQPLARSYLGCPLPEANWPALAGK
jgi:hypothetical protein